MLGLVMGYFGRWVDNVVGRFLDAVLAIPLIVLAILVLTALSAGNEGISVSSWQLIVVIGIAFTPPVARTVRSAVLAERDLDYVQAARLRGERSPYIMFAEILPNVTGPIIVEATVRLGYAVFTVATLAFLGYGPQPPSPDWGLQIAEQYADISLALVGGRLPGARDRDARRRDQPDRRFRPAGARRMSAAPALEPDVAAPALALRDLELVYRVRGRDREVVRGISLTVEQGSSYGLVGESGCGKSTVALSIVRYLPRNGRVVSGTLEVAGRDVLALRGEALRLYRRDGVSMVYQNPGAALNPTLRVGRQVEEVFALREARAAARPASGRWRRSARCTSPTRTRCSAAIRTSSRAGCSSGS